MQNEFQHIKDALEAMQCKIHKTHPTVRIQPDRAEIDSCCKTFETILFLEYNKALANRFEILGFVPPEPKSISISNSTISKEVRFSVISAFDDYIAARFLLNHGHAQQGAMLASTALEKYIKALIIATKGGLENAGKKHFDKWKELAWLLIETPYEGIFKRFDQWFLKILETAYKFRYYGNMDTNKITSIGFFINQFIGELDFVVSSLDSLTQFKEADRVYWRSPFMEACEKNNIDYSRIIMF